MFRGFTSEGWSLKRDSEGVRYLEHALSGKMVTCTIVRRDSTDYTRVTLQCGLCCEEIVEYQKEITGKPHSFPLMNNSFTEEAPLDKLPERLAKLEPEIRSWVEDADVEIAIEKFGSRLMRRPYGMQILHLAALVHLKNSDQLSQYVSQYGHGIFPFVPVVTKKMIEKALSMVKRVPE